MNQKSSVLIVEDNESMVFLLSELIESNPKFTLAGFSKDGEDALEKIKLLRPSIVILDICLPLIDGIDVLKELNKERDVYFPKVVVTSCMGLDDITKTAMNLGASYYFVKPFDSNSLLAKLEQLIEVELPFDNADVEINPLVVDDETVRRTVQTKITALLHMIGVPPHTKGYVYIKEAVELLYYDSMYAKITKVLYPKLAETFEVTSFSVERAIRNTIDITIERGEWEQIEKIFHGSRSKGDKLTNSEFIAAAVEYIKSDR